MAASARNWQAPLPLGSPAARRTRCKRFWATWNSCNGIFDVFPTQEAAIADAEGKDWIEDVIPVQVCEDLHLDDIFGI